MRWSRTTASAVSFLFLASLLGACQAREDGSELTQRQAAVAEAGSTVMPFDLDASTHVFQKLDGGGLQQVVSDTGDPEQIRLIREHLLEESERFARGDFQDPGAIHGEDMPGLRSLVAGHQRLAVQYAEIEGGAEVLYTTGDPELVEAVHAWFDAQVSDHGAHAEHGPRRR